MKQPPKIYNVYAITGLATIGGLIQGFDVSSMSAIIGTEQYKTYFNSPDSVLQGGITACMAGGSLLGALFSSWTSDRRGRRDSLFIACIIWIIGSSLMSAVQNVAMLIVSRMINGFAVGMLTSQGPILIAEISLPRNRGRLLAFEQWMVTWGILVMWDEAIEILANLHANGNQLDPVIIAEVQEIKEKIDLERQFQSQSWLELFRRRNIIRVHCAIFAHIWAQYTGTNAMLYYIVYIFQMAGLTGNNTLLAASIQYVINVVMTVPALIFMDKWSRRRLMMAGSFLMAMWLFTEGALMATYGHAVPGGLNGVKSVTWVVTNPKASRAIIACSYLFIATFAPTWGPVGWVYPTEIIPLYIRSKTVSLATVFNWAMNFSLTFFTPPAFQNIQYKVYFIFGIICLEEMDDVFTNEPIWAFKARPLPSKLETNIERARKDLEAGESSLDAKVVTQNPKPV
ncbi:hypothetical protein FQN52_003431 [Onygenales sp. PD_12]|nr:hypothetical protein FQN52_003431 [Onygenales sp. PD_12]